jgi:VanZ family protein
MLEHGTSIRLKGIARKSRILAVLFLIVLFIATHLPSAHAPSVNYWDKALHFSGYAVLTVFVLFAAGFSFHRLNPRHYFAVWLAAIVYGAIDEWTQPFAGRTCDVNDWAADVLGATSGIIIYQWLAPLLHAVVGPTSDH